MHGRVATPPSLFSPRIYRINAPPARKFGAVPSIITDILFFVMVVHAHLENKKKLITGDHIKYLVKPTVHAKTYIYISLFLRALLGPICCGPP